MDHNTLYWIGLLLVLIGVVVIVMLHDRSTYVCPKCGKSQKLIGGSDSQNAWCDECRETLEMVRW